ncbi:amidohydrolase family protein [Peptococcus simiae]|uniref:amidohydrolase family protein n=1 Tax=Peptococcus simiae TaxID=1643805 RepID=UPI00398160DE
MIKKRRWKKAMAFLLSLILVLGVSFPGTAKAVSSSDLTLYKGGDIITVNSQQPTAEAVLCQGDKIIAVGELADLEAQAGSQAQVIDLKGKTLIPGFYDAHSHFYKTGAERHTQVGLNAPPVGNINNMDKLISALKNKAEASEPDEWIIGSRYDDGEMVEKRHPTADELDKASTNNPIYITHFSGHNAVVNHKALEMAGITKDTPDPEGGQIGRDKDGNPNGQLWESAMNLVFKLIPAPTYQDQLEALAVASDIYAKAGITTVNEGNGTKWYDLYLDAVKKGYVKQHINYWFNFNEADDLSSLMKKTKNGNEMTKYSGQNNMIAIGGLKAFDDGSPQLRTAYLTDPYYTLGEYDEGWKAYPRMPREKLIDFVVDAHQKGINRIYIHANGDAAIDDLLDAYERVDQGVKDGILRKPLAPMRHVVIHSQFSREEQYERMARIGAIPSFLIMHPYFLGDRHWDIYFGPDRSARMSPTRDAANQNLRFSLHCDAPVFPVDPLLMLQTAVMRQSYSGRDIFTTTYDKDKKYRSVDQRITATEALKALTLDAAYANGEEDVAGSIEVGKRADLTILGANPLKIDPSKIKDIPVKATIVNGSPIYDSDKLFINSEKPEASFKDIKGHWAVKDINRASQEKRVSGISSDCFAPDETMTRAMAVSILYRMANQPEVSQGKSFKDVVPGDWYAVPVAWAKVTGVANGTGQDCFSPQINLTREEAAALLKNYHQAQKANFAVVGIQVPTFVDTPSPWAKDSVEWALEAELLRGMDTSHLDPQGPVTRAQWVVMTNRYLDRLEK